ncbi:hypothetical protein FHY55_11115 [Oceanicola sp. D3]|uniref:hypothetical protein n=1 Tax=Oceanicola sp. D3 TaxID=2587163 RepID=UPI00111D6A44|nr:hypothetical protein [Oceanicola sp. D3]QDC09763.1 hypothetical protein FHY55_11115 [Oceanicola sp. D3]
MASIEMHKSDVRAALQSAVTGLRTTERAGGYVLSEDGEIVASRVMGRLIGVSFILAGLGLLALPVVAGAIGKAIVGVALVAGGGFLATRSGKTPRGELEVDLEKGLLRKRELTTDGGTRLVAQWSFDEISGLDLDSEAGRGVLILETGKRRGTVLRGAPDALRHAAQRIGADLLRSRAEG